MDLLLWIFSTSPIIKGIETTAITKHRDSLFECGHLEGKVTNHPDFSDVFNA